MGRFIENVHQKIMEIIPENEKDFRKELSDYIESIWNKAPEVRQSSESFIPYYLILSKYIPNYTELNETDPDWWIKTRDIFSDINN